MTRDKTDNRPGLNLRRMTRADIATVLRLEREIFTDDWPRSAFEEALDNEACNLLVAETAGCIVGYACWLVNDGEVHLINIAVGPEWRRKSVAKQLLDHILSQTKAEDCSLIMLEVRPLNSGAIRFYEKFDFKEWYRRPDYYSRPVEDALVMGRYLTIDPGQQ